MARSFENFDVIRIKQNLFNVPKHTIGKVLLVRKHSVHVVFSGVGVAVLAPDDIELVPRVVSNVGEQLTLFKDTDVVRATLSGDKVVITPFLGTSDNILPDDPECQIVTTKRQLWMSWISSTSFEEFCHFVGFPTGASRE